CSLSNECKHDLLAIITRLTHLSFFLEKLLEIKWFGEGQDIFFFAINNLSERQKRTFCHA
ncbi:hypothetical protein ACQP3J_33490, partial [Escherichia coli]